MPGRIEALTETGIIAEMRAELARLRRGFTAAQTPIWEYQDWVLTGTPPTSTYTLTYQPYGINHVSLNGLTAREGVDYTMDYTLGVLTFSATKTAGDVLSISYVTTGDLTAASGPADGGLGLLSDWTQDQGVWALDVASKFKVSSAAGGGTRFGGAFNGFFTLIHDNGAATVHYSANVSHNSAATDGVTVAFNPATGAGYRISWDGGSFHGGIQLYRYTNDTTGAEVANATGSPITSGTTYDAVIEVVYSASTGVVQVYFDAVSAGTRTLRISYTDGSPLTGTWFGMVEYYSNLGGGRWWNWAVL